MRTFCEINCLCTLVSISTSAVVAAVAMAVVHLVAVVAVVVAGAVLGHLAAAVPAAQAGHHRDSNILAVCKTQPKQLSNLAVRWLSVLSGPLYSLKKTDKQQTRIISIESNEIKLLSK